jgi:hypothetical protein
MITGVGAYLAICPGHCGDIKGNTVIIVKIIDSTYGNDNVSNIPEWCWEVDSNTQIR